MKLSKKQDVSRRWRSFKRHVFLMLQPFIISLVAVVLWRWLREHGYYLPREDEAIFTVPVIATLAVAFGINATLSLSLTWEKYRKVVVCVLKKDKKRFLLFRDERMPVVLHLFLAVLSFFLLGMVMLLDYRVELSGMVSVFIISFLVGLYWIVIPQLENPAKGAWFSERIPEEWLNEDVDKFFELEESNDGRRQRGKFLNN